MKNVVLVGGAALATLMGILACGGSGGPTQTPTVAPTTTTTTTLPTSQLFCSPTPPPLYGINVKVHSAEGRPRRILDSRPIVINVDNYCERAGVPGKYYCFTRTEGDPSMFDCDMMAIGRASNGRWGPTWYYNDKPCDGGNPGCTDQPDNQFLVIAKGSGKFEACAADNVPLSQDPERPGARCGTCWIDDDSVNCNE